MTLDTTLLGILLATALSWLGMALIIGSGIVTTVMRARQSGA